MTVESEAAAVRLEVRRWLEEHWDAERPLSEWRALLVDSGWGCPTWPVEWYGRGLPANLAGVPGIIDIVKVDVPSAVAAGIRRLGISAARKSACAMGASTKKATNRLTPP